MHLLARTCESARPRPQGAQRAHRTQLVWFRKLFLVFSVYTFINRLFELEPDPGLER